MRRLLAEDVFKHQKQADDEIHEDQLLNFLINTFKDTITLDFGNNAEINTEDLDI